MTTLFILARISQPELLTLCYVDIVLHFAPIWTLSRRITCTLAGGSHLAVLVFSHNRTTDNAFLASERCTFGLLFRTQQMIIKSRFLFDSLSIDNAIPSLIRCAKLLKLIIEHLDKEGLLGILFN